MAFLLIVTGIVFILMGVGLLGRQKPSPSHISILDDPNYIRNEQLQTERDAIQKELGPLLENLGNDVEKNKQVRHKLDSLFRIDALLSAKQKIVLIGLRKDYLE